MKKRIRDMKAANNHFPTLHQWIMKDGLVPHILCNDMGMFWDGCSVVDQTGKLTSFSASARKEMVNMILSDYFGHEVKDAFIDGESYWKIRDRLIEWPNQAEIEKHQLRVLVVPRAVAPAIGSFSLSPLCPS